MTTVDLSWKLRAQKAESKLAERDRELQQAREQATIINSELFEEKKQRSKAENLRDTWQDCAEKTGQLVAKTERALSEAREEIARLKEALTKADFFLSHSGNQRAIVGNSFEKPSGRWEQFQDTKKSVHAALHPVPEKPKS